MRVLKYIAIIVALVVLGIAAILAMSFGPLQSQPASQTLYGVNFVAASSSVAIVPTGANQVLLVDSGMDGKAVNVLAELRKLGMNAESVTAILLTHGHFDHISGAAQFPNAQLMALAPEADLVAGLSGSHGLVTRLFSVKPTGLKVTRVLQGGETLTIGQAVVKVFAVPGHTMGSAAYLIDGILFLGDSANATSSGKLQSATYMFTDDPRLNEASLRGLEQILRESADPVRAISFGHSGILDKGLAPLSAWAQTHPG